MTTSPQHMSLDEMLEQYTREAKQAEEAKKLKEQQDDARRRGIQSARMEQLLAGCLKPEFCQAIGLEIVQYVGYEELQTRASFTYLERRYYLAYAVSSVGQVEGTWSIRANQPKQPHTTTDSVKNGIDSKDLQREIIAILAARKAWVQLCEEQDRVREQQQAERLREEERQWAEEQRKKDEQVAQARAEHERLSLLVEQEKQKVLDQMWQWPQGVTIDIYYAEWCKGAFHVDEDEDASFGYEGGWTSVSALDHNGYVRLEPAHINSFNSKLCDVRILRLIPGVHKPTFELHQHSSCESLPDVLCQDVVCVIPGLNHVFDSLIPDIHPRLVQAEEGQTCSCKFEVGQIPLEWIRTLVESTARAQKKEF